MTRRNLIAGNWKMNTDLRGAVALADEVATGAAPGIDVALFPPFPWLIPVADSLKGSDVTLGAQDCWTVASGAFTGAVSPEMLSELCKYVIVGHSERRATFGETSGLVSEKAAAAQASGLTPIVCVGEDLEVREMGLAIDFVSRQLNASLATVDPTTLDEIVIAYEPVWAIGTGIAATNDDAQQMCAAIRGVIAELKSGNAELTRILYGGSVTAANAADILAGPDIDGALVGGASLKAASFLEIVATAPR